MSVVCGILYLFCSVVFAFFSLYPLVLVLAFTRLSVRSAFAFLSTPFFTHSLGLVRYILFDLGILEGRWAYKGKMERRREEKTGKKVCAMAATPVGYNGVGWDRIRQKGRKGGRARR